MATRTTTIRTMGCPSAASGVEFPSPIPAELTLEAVFDAYFDCRKHKRTSINQLRFEMDLERNLVALYRDLSDGSYRIGRSIAFVVTHPKIREIWAAWVRALIRQAALHDPRPGAVFRSSRALFDRVSRHKSLLHAPPGKGLPIGNLTSQFFANVYLNELDQYVKHRLRARYYGRYVDDIVLFHDDPGVLNSWYAQIDGFLQERLALRLHPRKKHLNRLEAGIDFIGFIIKPGRTYLRQTSLSRCKRKIAAWERSGSPVDPASLDQLSASVNSYLGMLRQVDGYRARKALCSRLESLFMKADEQGLSRCPNHLPQVVGLD